LPTPSILIIGIGNDYRSDDAVGLLVARALQARKLPRVSIQEATGEGTALLEAWKGAGSVILIDAVTSQSPAGTIHQLDAQTGPISPEFFALSTHAFGVAEAIELARVLGNLPQHLVIYGIEGKRFVAGVGLSPEVERAAHQTIERITRLVQSWQQPGR
jgi:hydrogenase maturation protease